MTSSWLKEMFVGVTRKIPMLLGEGVLFYIVLFLSFGQLTISGVQYFPFGADIPRWLQGVVATTIGIKLLTLVARIPVRNTLFVVARNRAISNMQLALFFFFLMVGDSVLVWLWEMRAPQIADFLTWKHFGGGILTYAVLALQEEWLFRGYLLERFTRISGRSFRLLGLHLSMANVASALVFTLCHLCMGTMGVLVFFPSLFFGMLREKSGNILLPTLVHAVFNIWQLQF